MTRLIHPYTVPKDFREAQPRKLLTRHILSSISVPNVFCLSVRFFKQTFQKSSTKQHFPMILQFQLSLLVGMIENFCALEIKNQMFNRMAEKIYSLEKNEDISKTKFLVNRRNKWVFAKVEIPLSWNFDWNSKMIELCIRSLQYDDIYHLCF